MPLLFYSLSLYTLSYNFIRKKELLYLSHSNGLTTFNFDKTYLYNFIFKYEKGFAASISSSTSTSTSNFE